MKKIIIESICRLILNGSIRSLGLPAPKKEKLKAGIHNIGELMFKTRYYPIFIGKKYEPLAERSDASHIVLDEDGYRIYSYSSDRREDTTVVNKFNNFVELAEFCAERQITISSHAIIQRDEELQKLLRSKNPENMIKALDMQKNYKERMSFKLKNYFNRYETKLLNKLLMQLH
ncbi:MAG: hypothetical protein ABIK92_14490 [Pseudomonadota bacterium]